MMTYGLIFRNWIYSLAAGLSIPSKCYTFHATISAILYIMFKKQYKPIPFFQKMKYNKNNSAIEDKLKEAAQFTKLDELADIAFPHIY